MNHKLIIQILLSVILILQIIIWSSNSINLVSIKKSVIANCDPYTTADEVVKEIRKDGKESNYQYKGWMK